MYALLNVILKLKNHSCENFLWNFFQMYSLYFNNLRISQQTAYEMLLMTKSNFLNFSYKVAIKKRNKNCFETWGIIFLNLLLYSHNNDHNIWKLIIILIFAAFLYILLLIFYLNWFDDKCKTTTDHFSMKKSLCHFDYIQIFLVFLKDINSY